MSKYVFFDFHQTLAHWPEKVDATLKRVANEHGVEINSAAVGDACGRLFGTIFGSDANTHNAEGWKVTVGDAYQAFAEATVVSDNADVVTKIAAEVAAHNHALFGAKGVELYDETDATLAALRAKGVRLAVVSNWDNGELDQLLTRLGIAHHFDLIVASHSEMVKAVKPSPDIFQWAMVALGIGPEQVIAHVGDEYDADINGANGVGIKSVLVDRKGKYEAKPSISSLSELVEMV